jgi:hypothetical protein
MRDRYAPRGQFRRERAHRQIGLLGQPGQQPVPAVASERRTAAPSDFARHLPTPCTLSLPDPHRRSDRHTEPFRRSPDRLPILKGLRNPCPDIYGQWQNHASLLHLVETLNHETPSAGILIPIQSGADVL